MSLWWCFHLTGQHMWQDASASLCPRGASLSVHSLDQIHLQTSVPTEVGQEKKYYKSPKKKYHIATDWKNFKKVTGQTSTLCILNYWKNSLGQKQSTKRPWSSCSAVSGNDKLLLVYKVTESEEMFPYNSSPLTECKYQQVCGLQIPKSAVHGGSPEKRRVMYFPRRCASFF